MSDFTTAAKNLMLDALSGFTMALHTGDPGAAGTANEVTGGTYARQACTFGAASNGSRNLTSVASFAVPAGTTVAWVTIWAGATFIAKIDHADEVFGGAGTLEIDSATLSLINVA